MSRSVLWRLCSLLSILQISVLAELNYHGPTRGAPSIFSNTGAESELGENAIADPWDIPPHYGFGDNILADSHREAIDEANSLQLNIAISPPSDQAQSPDSLWLSESVDCQPSKNPIPNNKRRIRRQSDVFCPFPTNNMNNQFTPGAKAGTQPAALQISPTVLRQDRKPTNMLNSDDQPKPILKGDPLSANGWVCNHRTTDYPVCADYEHAMEMPLGSGSYQLLMAKLYDPANCEAPDILWCCGGVNKRRDGDIISIDHLKAVEYPLTGYRCFPQQPLTGASTHNPLDGDTVEGRRHSSE